jgi:hypothetical protein
LRSRSSVVRRFTRSEEAPPKAPAPETDSAPATDPSLVRAADGERVWLLLGGPTVRFDGGAPGLGLGLGGSRRFDWFLLGVSAEARLLAGSVERDARVVEISQYSVSGELGVRLFAAARFLGILSGSFGARRLEMVAHGEAETVAILAHHTSPLLGVSGLFAARWSESFGVGLAVGMESLLDAPRITLGTAEFGWGRPSFFIAPKFLATF